MSEVWACQGCGRVGTSARDLLRQGCEGKPERFVPERDRDNAVFYEGRTAAKLAATREVLDNDAQSFYEARARILAILDGEGEK